MFTCRKVLSALKFSERVAWARRTAVYALWARRQVLCAMESCERVRRGAITVGLSQLTMVSLRAKRYEELLKCVSFKIIPDMSIILQPVLKIHMAAVYLKIQNGVQLSFYWPKWSFILYSSEHKKYLHVLLGKIIFCNHFLNIVYQRR